MSVGSYLPVEINVFYIAFALMFIHIS